MKAIPAAEAGLTQSLEGRPDAIKKMAINADNLSANQLMEGKIYKKGGKFYLMQNGRMKDITNLTKQD